MSYQLVVKQVTSALLLSGVVLWLSGSTARAAAIYSGGHGDLGVEYDPGEDPHAFHVHVHVHAGSIVDGAPLADDEEFDGGDVSVLVPASANIGRTSGTLMGSFEPFDYTTAAFDFLGTAPGERMWLLPFDSADASFYGTPFLGIAAEEIGSPSQWVGAITFKMTGFTGPGEVSVFTGAGTRRWDTADGSFANDSLNIGAGGHGHFNWAFTAPGIYEVQVEVSGTNSIHGAVSGSGLLMFQVVPEPSSLLLLVLGGASLVWRGRRRWMGHHA
jgi:surface-anchored protein